MDEETKIKPDDITIEEDDDYEETPESPPLAEQIEIKRPSDIAKQTKDDQNKYESILNQNPEMKNYLEYMWLKQKVANGQPLTAQETQLKADYDLMAQREAEENKEAEAKAQAEAKRASDLQKQILMEYAETKEKNPEKIVKVSETEVILTGNTSIPKLIKFILTLNKAKKKGGKVLVQVFRSRKVLVKWTTSDVTFVEFYSNDEKGNQLMEVTRFNEYPYSFEGTPVPVLFAVQGYAEGFDFFDNFRKDISSEMASRIATRAFHAGINVGAAISDPKKKNGFLEGLMPFVPIIMIAGFGIMGFLLYQMYNDNTLMLHTIQGMQNQLNTQFPDVNALVIR